MVVIRAKIPSDYDYNIHQSIKFKYNNNIYTLNNDGYYRLKGHGASNIYSEEALLGSSDVELIEYRMRLPINYNESHWSKRKKAREEYIKLQNNKCWYCGNSLDDDPPDKILDKQINESLFPANFFKWPIHLHHSHETGMTIGTVHSYCNAVLWEYEDE